MMKRQQSSADLVCALATCLTLPQTGLYSFEGRNAICHAAQFATTGLAEPEFSRTFVDFTNESLNEIPALFFRRDTLPPVTSPFSSDIILSRAAYGLIDKEVIKPSEILLKLRAHFSLNTSELARVIGVERPTIYAWAQEKSEPRENHRARLATFLRLTQFWTRISRQPLGALKTASSDGRGIIDLLAAHTISEPEVCEVLRAISHRITTEGDKRRVRAISDIARKRGWEKVDRETAEQTAWDLKRPERA